MSCILYQNLWIFYTSTVLFGSCAASRISIPASSNGGNLTFIYTMSQKVYDGREMTLDFCTLQNHCCWKSLVVLVNATEVLNTTQTKLWQYCLLTYSSESQVTVQVLRDSYFRGANIYWYTIPPPDTTTVDNQENPGGRPLFIDILLLCTVVILTLSATGLGCYCRRRRQCLKGSCGISYRQRSCRRSDTVQEEDGLPPNYWQAVQGDIPPSYDQVIHQIAADLNTTGLIIHNTPTSNHPPETDITTQSNESNQPIDTSHQQIHELTSTESTHM